MTGGQLTSELLMQAYRAGIFPMSESRNDPEIFWVDPKLRGIIPLDGFHISRSLAKTMRRRHFRLSINCAFEQVVSGCADREDTWINAPIFGLYCSLFQQGQAHSIEVWEGKSLVGGVYGVTSGAAFFGESMFSRQKDASKVALAYLIDRLQLAGFTLFDTQFTTPHLESLGAIEIPRAKYRQRLEIALGKQASFLGPGPLPAPQEVLQRNAHTS